MAISNKKCDVLITGGGIAGCGIARDLSSRGIETILVEKDDFGSGTTGKSSRLIHGGLRYLEHFEFGLIREGLRERDILLHIAPHLVKPLKFIMPVYEDSKPGMAMLKVAMVAYDILSYDKTLPNHSFIPKDEVKKLLPFISEDRLKGAFTYFDAQAEMVERLCLVNALDAEANGTLLYNHSTTGRMERVGGRIRTAEIVGINGNRDTVEARVFINATGPWLDGFLSASAGLKSGLLTTTKGVHIITKGTVDSALVLNSGDGRPLFVIPWMGKLLIGTTDTLCTDDPNRIMADGGDIRYLTAALEKYAPGIIIKDFDVYAGLRPLARKNGEGASDISRDYKIVDHRKEGIDNLISVAGSKITEYRSMSEKVGDLVSKKLGRRMKSSTSKLPLPGGGTVAKKPEHISDETYANLVKIYGSDAYRVTEIMNRDVKLSERVCVHAPDVLAQVYFSVNFEHAKTIDDFMLRRSNLVYCDCHGLDGIDKVADLMGKLLNWDGERIRKEILAYQNYVSLHSLIR